MPTKISASLAAAPLVDLRSVVRDLEEGGTDMIHFDVEDGSFVPAMNLGTKIIQDLRPLTPLPFDVHLMMRNPEWIIPELARCGANRVAVHAEACAYPRRVLGLIDAHRMQAGLAFNPGTAIPPLAFCLPYLAFVVVLTTEPEISHSDFLPAVLSKVVEGKKQAGPAGVEWVVDGGITAENVAAAVDAGADVVVVGRGIFEKGGPRENVRNLHAAIKAGKRERSDG